MLAMSIQAGIMARYLLLAGPLTSKLHYNFCNCMLLCPKLFDEGDLVWRISVRWIEYIINMHTLVPSPSSLVSSLLVEIP